MDDDAHQESRTRDIARNSSSDLSEQRRIDVIRLWKMKMKQMEIARELGVSVGMVCQTIQKYKRSGYNLSGLKSKPRGRTFGEKRLLTAEQEILLLKAAAENPPNDTFLLWKREDLHNRIQIEFGIKMPLRTLSEYMRRWGLTQPVTAQWERENRKLLSALARRKSAELYYIDVIDIPRAENKKNGEFALQAANLNCHFRALRASTPRGTVAFKIYHNKCNALEKIQFLDMLLRDLSSNVLLAISPSLRMSDNAKVRQLVAQHRNRVILSFLPRLRKNEAE